MTKPKTPRPGDIVSFEYYGNQVVAMLSSNNYLSIAFGYWDDNNYGQTDSLRIGITFNPSDVDNYHIATGPERYRFYRLYYHSNFSKDILNDLALSRNDIRALKELNDSQSTMIKALRQEIKDLRNANTVIQFDLQQADAIIRTMNRPFLYIKKTFPYITFHSND